MGDHASIQSAIDNIAPGFPVVAHVKNQKWVGFRASLPPNRDNVFPFKIHNRRAFISAYTAEITDGRCIWRILPVSTLMSVFSAEFDKFESKNLSRDGDWSASRSNKPEAGEELAASSPTLCRQVSLE
jgi:hypothetical protein